MLYQSTRGKVSGITFQQAVMMGLAEDGGLLLPSSVPTFSYDEIIAMRGKPYTEVAFQVIRRFVDDIPEKDLKKIIEKSYSTFTAADVIPVVSIGEVSVAELFHGPTFAFKDIALQFLGNIFEYILEKEDKELNIIGATSGDTGSSAIYGVRGKSRIRIGILYPDGRVSPVQELQMTTVADANVRAFAVDGTFDDCQAMVKELFNDIDFKRKYNLGAVNSINWARVMAQIVYYFYCYLQVADEKAKSVSFVVPTGNFGNIFAGYYARMMGLPIDKLVLATNANNILHRFISKGDYSLSDVVVTHSPSMDIQLASNFERYLYFLYNCNAEKVAESMANLKKTGKIVFSKQELAETQKLIISMDVTDKETETAIKRCYKNSGYILDPHTACGVEAAYKIGLQNKNVICLATAHPAKFNDVIVKTLGKPAPVPNEIAKLEKLPKKVRKLSNNIDQVKIAVAKMVGR